jgi:LuxR family maltose regulon positive regulatory protein
VLDKYKGEKTKVSPAIAQIYTLMASLHAKRLDLHQALVLAQKGLEISKQWNQIDTVTVGYIYLVEILIDRQEYAQAASSLDEIKALSLGFSPWFREIIEETEVKIFLASGDIEKASQWAVASGLDYRDEIIPTRRDTYITYLRILLAEGEASKALYMAEIMIKDCQGFGRKGVLLGLLPLKSLILNAMGKTEAALRELERALAMAEPQGYKRGFVQCGKPLVPLLRQAVETGVQPAFALEILEAIEGSGSPKPGRAAATVRDRAASGEGLLEPLSQREIEVLGWMAKGCTNQEIAQEMILSLHTIKSHARNIYGKLDVKNRTEAVTRARLLGLLP